MRMQKRRGARASDCSAEEPGKEVPELADFLAELADVLVALREERESINGA